MLVHYRQVNPKRRPKRRPKHVNLNKRRRLDNHNLSQRDHQCHHPADPNHRRLVLHNQPRQFLLDQLTPLPQLCEITLTWLQDRYRWVKQLQV